MLEGMSTNPPELLPTYSQHEEYQSLASAIAAGILDFCDVDGSLFPEGLRLTRASPSCTSGEGGGGRTSFCCYGDFSTASPRFTSLGSSAALSAIQESRPLGGDGDGEDPQVPESSPAFNYSPRCSTLTSDGARREQLFQQTPLIPDTIQLYGAGYQPPYYSSSSSNSSGAPMQRATVSTQPLLPTPPPLAFEEENCMGQLSHGFVDSQGASPPPASNAMYIDRIGARSGMFFPGRDNSGSMLPIPAGDGSMYTASWNNDEVGTTGVVGFRPGSGAGVNIGFCGTDYSSNDLQLQKVLGDEQQFIGGCSNSTIFRGSDMSPLDESTFKVGKLSVEERKEKIHRYIKKKNERNFSKKIKYACRKTLADSRPRVRGRFAKNDDFGETPRVSYANHADDDEDEVVIKEEDIDSSDIFVHLNSFKCNYTLESRI